MRLIPMSTRRDGNCAFHAALGEWDKDAQEFVYPDIQAIRKRVADKVLAIPIESHNLFPSVKEALKELIRGGAQQIQLEHKFPFITARQNDYKQDDERFEDLDSENFDNELHGNLIKEYAKFIQTPGIWLLPCELSIVAYALNMTIQQFGKNKHGEIVLVETYNPSQDTQTVARVYFDGINHYEAMEVDDSIFTKQSTEIISDVNPSLAKLQSEGSHPASGVKLALHGTIYQLKMITWVLYTLYTLEFDALISTEDDDAGKWDDLVARLPNNQKPNLSKTNELKYLYRFFQFKHKQSDEVISYGDLVTSQTGDFSLTKYLRSFLKIKKEQLKKGGRFSDGVFGDFCLCTNIGLDFSNKNKRVPIFLLQEALEEIKTADPLLEGPGRRYRFKKDFKGKDKLYATLKQNGDEMAALAKTLSALMQKPTEKIKRNERPFNDKALYQWLVDKNIVDGETKRVTTDFLKGKDLSQEALDFKALYDQGENAKGNALQNEDIDEFFKHFVLAVSLPNEIKLGHQITKKLGSEFNLLDAKFLSANLLEELLDWMKEKSGSFLSTQALSTFFDAMREKLSRLALIGPTIDYQKKLNGPGITFTPSKEISNFLTGNQKHLIYQTVGDLFLAGIQIYQHLQEPPHNTNDSSIFVTLKKAVRLRGLLIDAFKNSQLLVLSCNIPLEGKGKALLEELFKTESTAKIILITTANQIVAETICSDIKPLIIRTNNSFATLSVDSQEKLKKRDVQFQGKTLALENLPDALDAIDEAGLVELLNSVPEIGESLDNHTNSLYVERSLKYTSIIENAALWQKSSDIFAVSGVDINMLKTIVGNDSPFRIFSENENEKQAVENTESKQEKFPRHIILDSDKKNADTQFKQLCSTYPSRTIHYLTYENGHWIWQNSQGSLSGLRPYLATPSEVKKLDKKLDSRAMIIAAEPGMGKSWWLAKYAQQLKAQYPEAWVLHISLLAQEDKIKQIQFNGLDDIVTFFTQDASPFARSLFANRLQKTGKLIICLDGFDELQAEQQTKIIQLLRLLKSSKVQQLIITTRQHLQEPLEDALNTFAYGLIPFEKKNILDYLQRVWQDKLGKSSDEFSTNSKRVGQYANALIKAFSDSIDNADHFIGIPLQAKLLAEAFAEEAQAFCARDDKEPHIRALSLTELYRRFIHAKYQIFFQEKSRLFNNSYFPSLQNSLTTHLNHDHQYYAFTLLFPDTPLPTDLLTGNQEMLQTSGIIQFVAGKSRFIHRTFAEYFVAQFLIQQLQKPNQHSDHRQYKELLTQEIFKARNTVIKTFIEGFVKAPEESSPLKEIWATILSTRLLPKPEPEREKRFHIHHKESSVSQDPSSPTTSSSFTELKEKVDNNYRAWPSGPNTETSTKTDARAQEATALCQSILALEGPGMIADALTFLNTVIRHTPVFKAQDAIAAHLVEIFWHYVRRCIEADIVFDLEKIEAFSGFEYSAAYRAKRKAVEPVVIKRFKNLHPLMQEKTKVTQDFLQELTAKKIRYLALLKNLEIDDYLFERLKTFYPLFKGEDTLKFPDLFSRHYIPLLFRIATKRGAEVCAFLLEKQEYATLCELHQQQPSITLNTQQIETIFTTNGSLLWLERTGIDLVNTFQILTPNMAKVFNDILSRSVNGYSTKYAGNIWDRLLLPLLNAFGTTISKSNIDRYALLEMCVSFMAFSLKYTPHWDFSPTENGLRNWLIFIQNMLKEDFLSADHLANSINFLYFLSQYGLVFIDTTIDDEQTLLILDPHSEFTFHLSFPYHATLKDLLKFKANDPKDRNGLKTECNKAIFAMKGRSLGKRRNSLPLLSEDAPAVKKRKQETPQLTDMETDQ